METKMTKEMLYEYQMLMRNAETENILEKVAEKLLPMKAIFKEDMENLFRNHDALKEGSNEEDIKAVNRLKKHIYAELNCFLVGWADESLKGENESFDDYLMRRYMAAFENAANSIDKFELPSEKKEKANNIHKEIEDYKASVCKKDTVETKAEPLPTEEVKAEPDDESEAECEELPF